MKHAPWLIRLSAVLLAVVLSSSLGVAQTFYVSPNGDDAAAGSIDAPWQTLAGARDNLRVGGHLDGDGNITVLFRGGTYVLSETVVFGLQDSGSPDQRVTYAAMPEETPVFHVAPPGHWLDVLSGPDPTRQPTPWHRARSLPSRRERGLDATLGNELFRRHGDRQLP